MKAKTLDWYDMPNVCYSDQIYDSNISFFVQKGELIIGFSKTDCQFILKEHEHLLILKGESFYFLIGEKGCHYEISFD